MPSYVPSGTESARRIASANSPLHPHSRSKSYSSNQMTEIDRQNQQDSIRAHNDKIQARKRLKQLRKTGFGGTKKPALLKYQAVFNQAENAGE